LPRVPGKRELAPPEEISKDPTAHLDADALARYLYRTPMKNTYTITEAQAKLPKLVREATGGHAFGITKHGETVAYLISCERLEAILETLEIMANPKAMKAIRDARAGRTKMYPVEVLDDL
jgi:prevent-host-death family protein